MRSKIINRFKKSKAPGLPNDKKSPRDKRPVHNYKFDSNPIVEKALEKFKKNEIPNI